MVTFLIITHIFRERFGWPLYHPGVTWHTLLAVVIFIIIIMHELGFPVCPTAICFIWGRGVKSGGGCRHKIQMETATEYEGYILCVCIGGWFVGPSNPKN